MLADENGAPVCEYSYDAWGNLVSMTGDTALAALNPIRYRGYYQDTETGLYYLQSRYYDPTTMRFINADDPNIIQMGAAEKQELNLYAYCMNDPVNHVDPTGYDAIVLFNKYGASFGPLNFGHIAILIRYGIYWYYLSLNGASNDFLVGPAIWKWGAICRSYSINSTTFLYQINNYIKMKMGKNEHQYTDSWYIYGSFYSSYWKAIEYKNSSRYYNLFSYNCSQVAMRILSYGNVYSNIFENASQYTIPKDAFLYIKRKIPSARIFYA